MNQFLVLFFICSALVGIALLGLCIKVILKKNGTFPSGHVSESKELTEQGLTCAQSQDREAQSEA